MPCQYPSSHTTTIPKTLTVQAEILVAARLKAGSGEITFRSNLVLVFPTNRQTWNEQISRYFEDQLTVVTFHFGKIGYLIPWNHVNIPFKFDYTLALVAICQWLSNASRLRTYVTDVYLGLPHKTPLTAKRTAENLRDSDLDEALSELRSLYLKHSSITMSKPKFAILDDYQNIGPSHFTHLESRIEIHAFPETLDPRDPIQQDALIQRLLPFDVVLAMRERTPFSASVSFPSDYPQLHHGFGLLTHADRCSSPKPETTLDHRDQKSGTRSRFIF